MLQVLVHPSALGELGIVIQTLDCIDVLLYAILGDGGAPRANIKSLVSESESLLGRLQEALMYMACGWDAGHWPLFATMCGRFEAYDFALIARRQVLQCGAALCDHFELRM